MIASANEIWKICRMPKSIKTAANTEKEKGKISRKVCEIVPATSLGILMVIFLLTKKL